MACHLLTIITKIFNETKFNESQIGQIELCI